MSVKDNIPSISVEIDDLIKHLSSINMMINTTIKPRKEALNRSVKEMTIFVNYLQEQDKLGDSTKPRLLSMDEAKHYSIIKNQSEMAVLADTLIKRSFLISLISQYDAFLGRLIHALFLLQPKSLDLSEKNITFSQLQEFASIEAAREYIIEKEIEGVLRKSHTEQFEWLENKFCIKLREGLSIWSTFIEITERRNLCVHNRGIVNNQYLSICKKNKVELQKDVNLGIELGITHKYLEIASACIFEIGVKLAHVLWRKVQPTELNTADTHLNNICFNLLSNEQYKLASVLLDFATTVLKKYGNESRKRTFIINRAQAYKWLGEAEITKKIINSEDWTATSDDFKLAEAVILDDFETADTIVKRIGNEGAVSKNAYREWPLFKEYRKSENFQRIFEDVFKESLQATDKQLKSQLDKLLLLTTEFSEQPSEEMVNQSQDDNQEY